MALLQGYQFNDLQLESLSKSLFDPEGRQYDGHRGLTGSMARLDEASGNFSRSLLKYMRLGDKASIHRVNRYLSGDPYWLINGWMKLPTGENLIGSRFMLDGSFGIITVKGQKATKSFQFYLCKGDNSNKSPRMIEPIALPGQGKRWDAVRVIADGPSEPLLLLALTAKFGIQLSLFENSKWVRESKPMACLSSLQLPRRILGHA